MFKLSSRGEYGLRAMRVLAEKGAFQPVPLETIAREEDISINYLEQLFLRLRRADLVKSVRGPNGGYQLKRSPEKISVGKILRSVEGPIAPQLCVLSLPKGERCSRINKCSSRDLWVRLAKKIEDVLEQNSLKDLME